MGTWNSSGVQLFTDTGHFSYTSCGSGGTSGAHTSSWAVLMPEWCTGILALPGVRDRPDSSNRILHLCVCVLVRLCGDQSGNCATIIVH
jgi:hypothetical protein